MHSLNGRNVTVSACYTFDESFALQWASQNAGARKPSRAYVGSKSEAGRAFGLRELAELVDDCVLWLTRELSADTRADIRWYAEVCDLPIVKTIQLFHRGGEQQIAAVGAQYTFKQRQSIRASATRKRISVAQVIALRESK